LGWRRSLLLGLAFPLALVLSLLVALAATATGFPATPPRRLALVVEPRREECE
jgi:hypothetical protein